MTKRTMDYRLSSNFVTQKRTLFYLRQTWYCHCSGGSL